MPASNWIHIGCHGDYHWLEVEGEAHIWWIVRAFPEFVQDKYIAAPSLSGAAELSEAESGWSVRNGIAYSPQLSEGFTRYLGEEPPSVLDEWYVFDSPKDLGERIEGAVFDNPPSQCRTMVFANWLVFRLSETQDESTNFLREWFWQQMDWIQPEAFVSESPGCCLLVTKNVDLMEAAMDYLCNIDS